MAEYILKDQPTVGATHLLPYNNTRIREPDQIENCLISFEIFKKFYFTCISVLSAFMSVYLPHVCLVLLKARKGHLELELQML